MKVKVKINGIEVIIKNGKVFCNDKLLKQEVETAFSLGYDAPPQDGYYPQLEQHFISVELISIEGEPKNRIY